MNILALDIATKTGWKAKSASGVWDLKPNRGESEGMRVVRFKARVRELINMEQITLIAYERPAGMHKASIMVASEMVGVLKDLCIELGVELACYSAGEIKKHATGKGNATKLQMIEAARELGYNPKDDNEADAIHLYNLANDYLGHTCKRCNGSGYELLKGDRHSCGVAAQCPHNYVPKDGQWKTCDRCGVVAPLINNE